MRILYIANEQPDFLQDLLFHGLVSLLGPDSVIDFPPISRYHGRDGNASPFPMLDFDFPAPQPGELSDLVTEVDAIVISSLRDRALEHARRALALRAARPTVFVDGEDDPYVKGIARHVDLYFKREVLLGARRLRLRAPLRRIYHSLRRREYSVDPLRRQIALATHQTYGVIPLPFGIIDIGFVPESEKIYDIAFLGSHTSSQRFALRAELLALREEGYRVFLAGGADQEWLPWRTYLKILGQSRIGVSVRGLGFDTYRYWEIPYAGALLLAENPRLVIPENFLDGVEAVFARADRLAGRARALLAADTEEIARRGREALLQRHTSLARAQRVVDHIERIGS